MQHSLQHLTSRAQIAHNLTSFSPETRGTSLIAQAEQELATDLARLPESAHERYAAGYERYLSAWISAKSNCISWMITGPARFPVRKAEKANDREHAAYGRLQDFRRRAIKAILRQARGPVTVQGELAQARKQLADREVHQNVMKRINAAHKAYTKNPDAFDLGGFTDSERTLIVGYVPQYSWEPHPYAPYEFTNNLANIKRYRQRVAELEAKEARQQAAPQGKPVTGNGWEAVMNNEADRIQVTFTGKPAEDVRAFLKSHGFKWAPSQSAWQRKITANAIRQTQTLVIPFLTSKFV